MYEVFKVEFYTSDDRLERETVSNVFIQIISFK